MTKGPSALPFPACPSRGNEGSARPSIPWFPRIRRKKPPLGEGMATGWVSVPLPPFLDDRGMRQMRQVRASPLRALVANDAWLWRHAALTAALITATHILGVVAVIPLVNPHLYPRLRRAQLGSRTRQRRHRRGAPLTSTSSRASLLTHDAPERGRDGRARAKPPAVVHEWTEGASISAVGGVQRDLAPVDARDAGAELGVRRLLRLAEKHVTVVDDPVHT